MNKLEVKAKINFPVETAFDAFLHTESFKEFMFRTDTSVLIEASINPELGGAFKISEKRGNVLAEHFGTFVELDKSEKISFIFSTAKDADDTYVELYFKSLGANCEITLTHEIKSEYIEWKSKIEQSWLNILEKLNAYLTKKQSQSVQPKDSQGQMLNEGDSVKTIKDLKVKGSSMVIKRGTIVKKIHLINGNDEEIDCKVDGVALALETQWLVRLEM